LHKRGDLDIDLEPTDKMKPRLDLVSFLNGCEGMKYFDFLKYFLFSLHLSAVVCWQLNFNITSNGVFFHVQSSLLSLAYWPLNSSLVLAFASIDIKKITEKTQLKKLIKSIKILKKLASSVLF